ncbi:MULTISPECIES: twin-arginine translocase TatA/TatE family subunit [Pseudovibrio]|uniref:twin-arginine translocase TatA/TatE family subunit n=1 Tax=Stappiaceae TaxID=2821832 RepID=UPI00236685E2|nr:MULTISPECIES: twin-arginine translocase TatA/TatE family subunit [Pseudovibrio]MDD7908744.1 twin-arginine translocase TatA/TatE family subunit [Pseudovibrio exalbescens]MDX5592817.1 twin-arginine translocase TatA/TatE family subunit [Pseudovibrio sp. SPO723]
MGSIGIWQIVIIAVVVVLLFGRGKISELMGDVAKGINSFKKGLKDDAQEAASEEKEPKVLDHKASETVSPQSSAEKTGDQTKAS